MANNIYSYLDELGYTLSDGVTYYLNDNGTGLIPAGEFIPRDESNPSKCVAYLINGTQADLQYIGKAPSRAEFKESNAWAYSAGSHFSIAGLLTTDTVEAYAGSAIPTIPSDGQLHIAAGEIAYGIIIKRADVEIGFYPFSEYANNPATFIAHNISTVTVNKLPNAALINGSIANRGLQDIFHDLQRGVYFNGTQQVPLLADGSAFADGTPLLSGLVNDSNSFLDTGTKIQATATPRVSQAEKIIRKWTDANGNYIALSHADFTGAEAGDQDFNDISETDIVKDIRKHHKALTGRQLITEKVITNN